MSSPAMTDSFRHWDEFTLRLRDAPRACVLSDFDGTLTPLVQRPELPTLSTAARSAIESLVRNPYASFGVVSGRSLADIRRRVDVEGIWHVGNHGYEIRRPTGEEHFFYDPEDVRHLDLLREDLERRTVSIEGVTLEPKGPILAVHFRQVDPARVVDVERAFVEAVDTRSQRLMMTRGNMVLEARLRASCNKGTAIRFIRRELPSRALVIYFGDDCTDRDAFRELRSWGLSIQVGGEGAGLAGFTLPDSDAVIEAFHRIDQALLGPRGTPSSKAPWRSSS